MPRYVIGNVEIPVTAATATNAIVDPAALAIGVQGETEKTELKAQKLVQAMTDEQIATLMKDNAKAAELAAAEQVSPGVLNKALLKEHNRRAGIVAPPADGGSGGGSLLVYGAIAAIVGYFAWKKSKQSKASA